MENDIRALGELDLNKLILVIYEEIEDEELRTMIVSPGVYFNTNVMPDRIRLCFEAIIIAHWGFSKEVLTFTLMYSITSGMNTRSASHNVLMNRK
jgi:hypothetical protein